MAEQEKDMASRSQPCAETGPNSPSSPQAQAPSAAVGHTPGPWFTHPAKRRDHGARAPIFEDGLWVIKNDPELNAIAVVDWANDHDAPTRAQAEANARLIAAAPDLYEALKAFEAWEARVILEGDWRDECVKLTPELHQAWVDLSVQRNAALRKAEG